MVHTLAARGFRMQHVPHHHLGRLVPVALLVGALVACGGDAGTDTVGETSDVVTTAGATLPPADPGLANASAPETPNAPTQAAQLDQPAIWPAADVLFDTPEQAAADFVSEVLGVPPTLGEFQQGDARSGEIDLLSPGEGEGSTTSPRGVLLLRQLGPSDGWFVIGVANDFASISSPSTGASVAAGPLTVEGVGRGFEGTLNVTAFVSGDADAELDSVIATGGAMATAEPFSAELDLSAATPGAVVALLVRGDTGLETDPGEVGAIPIVIAGELPGSR